MHGWVALAWWPSPKKNPGYAGDGKFKDRCQEYFDEFFNVTNTWKEPDKCDETDIHRMHPDTKNICRRNKKKKSKNRKANGSDNSYIELWKLAGDTGIESLETTMNEVMSRGMPSSWRCSGISRIYKGKGSVLECGNYRGIHDDTLRTYNRE